MYSRSAEFIKKRRNGLKLLSAAVSAVLMLSFLPMLSVFADSAGASYEIEEPVMTIDIPTNITVVDSTTKQSSPLFQEGGFDYIQTMSKFRENGDYLYGKGNGGAFEFELAIIGDTDKIADLSKLSDKKRQKLLSEISQQPEVVECEFYNNNAGYFVKISKSTADSSNRTFSEEYMTVYDSKDITVRFSSVNDSLTKQELEQLKQIVDSIRFPAAKKLEINKLISPSEAFLFCLIIVSFGALVFVKISGIKKEEKRQQRRKMREEERAQRDAKERLEEEQEKKKALEKANDADKNKGDPENSENTEGSSEGSIDLDDAIANFTE